MNKCRPMMRPLLVVALVSIALAGSVLLWNYFVAFRGNILGFYRIGTVLPHSPYTTPSPEVLEHGEAGYDGQIFLTLALDPALAHPQSMRALDNPRYRYRRILFPLLGYLLSLGQRPLVPFTLVLINGICLAGIVVVIGRMFGARQQSVWSAFFVLGIPGYWCALLLTTSDLLAALLLSLSLLSYMDGRYKALAVFYGLAALTHETMLVVIGSLIIPLLAGKQWRDAGTVLAGCIPALLWNIFVLWRIPSEGSTSGLLENFTFPGVGILTKLQTALTGPVSLKWLFDTSAFFLLCGTFCLLIFYQRDDRRRSPVLSCTFAYLGFFCLSRFAILSYYIDFLRVYGSVTLLLAVSLQSAKRPPVMKTALWIWCAMSIAFVAAYSTGVI